MATGIGYRILLVDDEEDVLYVFRRALEKYGYVVESFSSPEKALERFRANPKQYDLVVSDVRMPGMTGYELAQGVRKLNRRVKLMLVSAFDIDARVGEAFFPELRVSEVLTKPVAYKEICRAVERQLLSSSSSSSSSKAGQDV
ncbi:response regulator [Nitrososphaera sp.]|uniref:response regulator n=1 Tax=Nitrososphaera sp. TaxID=1971748 RepID=UPI00307CF7FB